MSNSRRPTLSERQNILLLNKIPRSKILQIENLVIQGQQRGRGIESIISGAMKILGPLGKTIRPFVIEKIILPLMMGQTPAIFSKKGSGQERMRYIRGGQYKVSSVNGLVPLGGRGKFIPRDRMKLIRKGKGALKLPGTGRRKGKGSISLPGGYGTSSGAKKNPLLTKAGARKNPWIRHKNAVFRKYKNSGKSFIEINKIAKQTYKKGKKRGRGRPKICI